MKSPSSSLFDLIHSLTSSEKRYFKVFSSTHVIGYKNNYEKLFQAFTELPANEPYDETAFKKRLTVKRWTKNFAVEKKILEDMLMKAMRAYNAEKSANGALNDIIANIHFLYNKGLLSAANKELQKGIALANEIENLPGLLILYQLKLNITRITQTASDIKEAHEDLEAETRILSMLDTERKVVHARREIYNLNISGQLKKNMPRAKSLIADLEVLENTQPLTYKARISLFFLRAMVAEKEGRFVDAMQQYEQANAIWKKNELKLQESYSNLRGILSNYLVCAHYAERFDVYPAIIEQIESFPADNVNDQASTFLQAKGARLIYLLNTENKGDAPALLKEIEDGLKKFQLQLSRHETIYLNTNVCLLYFQIQDYTFLIPALSNTFSVIGRDEKMYPLVSELKFIEIMAHFSLKNHDLLEYQLRNTDRWLREHKINNALTDLLIKSFPSMSTEPQYTAIKKQLTGFDCPANLHMLKQLVIDWMSVNMPATDKKIKKEVINVNRPA